MMEKSIKVAAGWWASKLRASRVSTDVGINPKWSNDSVFSAMVLAVSRDEAREQYPEEKIQQFTALLESGLKKLNDGVHIWVGVDYHPCDVLEEAFQGADLGQSYGAFPVKTDMHIHPDAVTVGEGYRAAYCYLYGLEDALRIYKLRRAGFEIGIRADDWDQEREEWVNENGYEAYFGKPPTGYNEEQ